MKEFRMQLLVIEEVLCKCELDNERDRYAVAVIKDGVTCLKRFRAFVCSPLQKWKHSVLNIMLLEDRFFIIQGTEILLVECYP